MYYTVQYYYKLYYSSLYLMQFIIKYSTILFFLPTVTEKRQKSYVKQDMNQLIKFILKIEQVRVERNLDRTIEVA